MLVNRKHFCAAFTVVLMLVCSLGFSTVAIAEETATSVTNAAGQDTAATQADAAAGVIATQDAIAASTAAAGQDTAATQESPTLSKAALVQETLALATNGALAASPANANSDDSTPVAETGGKQYTSVKEACANVAPGDTITLLCDYDGEAVEIDKSCTFDLNGHTLDRGTFSMFYQFSFYVGKNVDFTLTDTSENHTGKLHNHDKGVKLNGKGGTFTLKNATIESQLPIELSGNYTKVLIDNSTLINDGFHKYCTYASGEESTIVMRDSTINANGSAYGVYIDGENESVYLYSSSINNAQYGVYNYASSPYATVNLESGSSITASEYAIYARGEINTTMNGNSSISSTGNAAVYLVDGSFTMNSGKVSATKYGVYFDKSYASTKFTVNGGTINSDDKVTCYYDYGEQPVGGVVTVTGGWLNGGNSSGEFDKAGTSMRTVEHEVSGGRFAHPVHEDWCADGYTPCQLPDGWYSVTRSGVTCTATFDANGGAFADGSTTQQKTVSYNYPAIVPDEPTRDGYTFKRWTTDKDGFDVFDPTTQITSDTTLYAQWTKNPEPQPTKVEKPSMTAASGLVYNGKQQTGVAAKESAYYTISDAVATKAGSYTCKVSLKDKKNYVWADGTTDDLTATWTIAQKAVNIKVHNANMIAGDPQPAYSGTVSGVVAGDDLKVSYYLDSSADTKTPGTYAIHATWAQNPNYKVSCTDGTLTVVKDPAPEKLTVTFQPNGGVLSGDAYQAVEKGQKATKPSDPTRTGYTFAGWYTAAEGGSEYTFEEAVEADLTLYAHWTHNLTVVDFPMISEDVFVYNSEQQVMHIPTSDYYQITGVTSAKDTEAYIATLSLKDKTNCVWEDGTTDDFHVFWSITQKHVTIDVADATMVAGAALPTFTGTVDGVCEGDDLKVGYSLESGADTSKPGTYKIQATFSDPKDNYVVAIHEGTLTATAAPAPVTTYQVTFNANGGKIDGQSSVAVDVKAGEKVSEPTAPTRDGYTFAGWYTAAEGGSAYDFSAAVENNLTLFAKWTQNPQPPVPVPTKVEKPAMTLASGLVYNGGEQTGVEVTASDYYTVSGVQATNAGTYTATVALKDKSTCTWADGTTDDLTVEWSIAKKPASIKVADATMVAGAALPAFSGTVEGVCTGDDLQVTYALESGADTTKAGTYKIEASYTKNANYEVTVTEGVLTVTAAPEPISSKVVRIAGLDRYDTMQRIVNEGFAKDAAHIAVLATGENFPDALVASTLAGGYDAPVLLTETGSLSKEVKAEIERLGIDTIYVLGGSASVSDKVLDEIEALGKQLGKTIKVTRVSGENRTATSLEAMNVLAGRSSGNFDTVIIASGKSREGVFGDALSISPYAYAKDAPILLTDDEGMLTAEELAAIKANENVKNIVIVGGSASVADVEGQLDSGYNVTRLAGETRYETSAAVAAWELTQGMNVTSAAIATGQNFPDALAGAALSGVKNSILLLADDTNSAEAVSVLEAQSGKVETLYIYGGTDSVSDTVKDNCAKAAGIKD